MQRTPPPKSVYRGAVLASRRDLLRASLASLAALSPIGCRPSGPAREDGRLVVSFWYAYGDLVRKVLLDLVARFNASQSRIVVKAVHQGEPDRGDPGRSAW